jgi:opacity protein-like surface antigen
MMSLKVVALLALLAAAPALAQDPAPAPTPAPKSGWLDVTAVAGIAHDVHSGWKKPVLISVVTAVGPHYGPIYVGGVGSYQGTDGVGIAVPIVTYVAAGKFHGWFRGWALQVGFRKQDVVTGSTAYYFLVGGSR